MAQPQGQEKKEPDIVEVLSDKAKLEALKEAKELWLPLGYSNLKRTYDAYQDLDLARARDNQALRVKLQDSYAAHVQSVLSAERTDARMKNLLANSSFFFTLNWLYELPEMWPFLALREITATGPTAALQLALVQLLRKWADEIEAKAEEA